MATLVLVLALTVCGGALIVAVLLTARAERRAEEARLALLSPAGGQTDARRRTVRTLLERLDGPALRFFSFGARSSWGVGLGGVAALGVGLVSGAAAGLGARTLGAPALAILPLAAAAFYAVPWMLLRFLRERVEARFVDRFPDAIDIVVRMLRAGLPVTAAIRVVAAEASSPVREAFAELADQILIGKPVPDALAEMGARVGLKDVRFFAVAVSLQQRTGGNLAEALDILSDIIRKRRAMRLKAKAVTAEVRLSAYVLAGIPIAVVLLFWLLDRSYLEVLFTDNRGRMLFAAATVMLVAGFAVMHQMMRSVARA